MCELKVMFLSCPWHGALVRIQVCVCRHLACVGTASMGILQSQETWVDLAHFTCDLLCDPSQITLSL